MNPLGTNTAPKKVRIGDLLIAKGYISEEQLKTALAEQKHSGKKLGATLIDLGFVKEDQLLELLSRQLNIPYIKLDNYPFDVKLSQKLPETHARRHRALVLTQHTGGLLVGMSDPTDIFAYDEISKILGQAVSVAVIRERELLNTLDLIYRRTEEISHLAGELNEELDDEYLDLGSIESVDDKEAPVVKLIQSIFEDAVQIKASDIHIEPDERELRIRQRVDGVLQEQVMNEKRVASAVALRLKLMSGLDISEKRLPQDGRFNIKVKNRAIDVRIATCPTQHGETIVMRLLDQTDGALGLEGSGMAAGLLSRLRQFISRPHGLILVTGPTGSGKTTTLYGALKELNTADKKIITVEDPVEYQLPRITQVQVHEKIGLSFGTVLRSALRQDPDILLVGEIRDQETAEIALRASMTGHLVLSTLHTNDAITSAMRLIDIGVEGYLVASSLRAVIAQRLVRKICDSCAKDYTPTPQEQVWLQALAGDRSKGMTFKKGAGCTHCNKTGYRGRIGVFELLEINGAMIDALRREDSGAFEKAAHEQAGFRPLTQCALDYAQQGLTSLNEVFRVAEHLADAGTNSNSAPGSGQ